MPIYVYKCGGCGDSGQEHIQPVNAPAPKCTECGESDLLKQVTAGSFRFERSVGWDGWERMGPGSVGRTVPVSKHIPDPVPQRNPGSRKL